MKCIVCKQETGKFDNSFRAGFCEAEYCQQQLAYGWGSVENARQAYRLMYARPDGTTSEVPLIWFPMPPVPATMYTHVDAARYKK